MTTKITNFQNFRTECDYQYNMYEPHFLLQGCETVTNFDGNEVDNGCWYCIVKLKEGVHTILAYDHTGGDECPFVVYCDWSRQPSCIGPSGHFTECKEFSNMEEAFCFLVREPSRYHVRYEEDSVEIYEKGKYDVVLDCQKGLGFLDSVHLVCTDEYYRGKTIEICQPKSYGRTVLYRRSIR